MSNSFLQVPINCIKLLMGLLLFSGSSYAHSLNVARFEIQSREGVGDYLRIDFTFHALEHMFTGEVDFAAVNSKEEIDYIKSTFVEYIKSGLDIQVNDKALVFGKGLIKLGHSSLIRLEILNLPGKIHSVNAHISCFQEVERQQNLFVLKTEGVSFQHSLNSHNIFQVDFGIFPGPEGPIFSSWVVSILIAVLSTLLLLSLKFLRRDTLVPKSKRQKMFGI
ncbi:MAG: hypothetical protein AAGA10_08545 [Bacteroidota bacterium]